MQVYKPTDQSVNGVGEIRLCLVAMVFPLFMGLPFAYANKALFQSTLELLFDQGLEWMFWGSAYQLADWPNPLR